MPNPAARRTGNTNTQNKASGSRMNSRNRTRVSCTSAWSASEFARGSFFPATPARTSEMVWSLISQMAPRQGYEDVLQCRRVSPKLGERNILPRQFGEQRGDGSVKFGHLQEHSAIFRSNFTDAFDAAQGGTSSAWEALPAVNSTICSAQVEAINSRGVPSAIVFAMIHNGHAVAKALGFVHVVGGEQNGAAGLFEFLDQFPQLAAGLRVEARGGFIEKKKIGIADQRAGQSQPLFLAAGKIAHARILFFFELHARDHLGGSGPLPEKAAKQADRFVAR